MPINENADSALYYENDVDYNSFDVAAQISINYEGECNALTGYYKLIPFFKKMGDIDAVNQIREICSDEKNHQEILKKLQMKYDKNIPIAED